MKLRHAIAASAVTVGCALTACAPSGASTVDPTPQAGPAVQSFWQYMDELQNLQGWQGLVLDEPGPAVSPDARVIYGGTPLQAFLYALQTGPTVQFVLNQ